MTQVTLLTCEPLRAALLEYVGCPIIKSVLEAIIEFILQEPKSKETAEKIYKQLQQMYAMVTSPTQVNFRLYETYTDELRAQCLVKKQDLE